MNHATTMGDRLALAGAVRALRCPASRSREREPVARWARRLLTDDLVLVVDVETTGLENAYAVQIAAVDRRGALVFNEYVQPNAVIEPAALGARQARGVPPKPLSRRTRTLSPWCPRPPGGALQRDHHLEQHQPHVLGNGDVTATAVVADG